VSKQGTEVSTRLPDRKLVGSDRVLAVLTELAAHPEGISLDELARAVDSPKSTVHRALAALRRADFAMQDGRGHYVLGNSFIRMAFAHHEARPDHVRVQDALRSLVERHQETAHYTVLEGRRVIYRSKVDPQVGAVRLTSTIGGSNPAHATASGKLLLSYELLDKAAVRKWVATGTLEQPTAATKITVEELHDELSTIRQRGYAVDDQENEPGVNCLALPVFLGSPTLPSGAISISAVAYRTPLQELVDDVVEIRRIIDMGTA
jgi:IclR family transcriptional regulator, acetate operon repressor